MAQEYDNTNSGALFRNEKKQSDRHPDYNGSVNVGGKDYWLNAWLKTAKSGKRYMSLSVQPKEPQGEETQVAPQTATSMEEDFPF